MTLKRKSTLIRLLLPLLVLRGLVPAGFMIDGSGNGLSMVICSGGVYKTVPLDRHGNHEAASDQGHPAQHRDSICPFSVAATGAPAPSALPMLVSAVSNSDTAINDDVEFRSPFGPWRAQQSRAPPSFI